LPRVLNSIARQTVRPDEVIVIDDGSTDGTAGLLANWRRQGFPLKAIHQQNQGASAARNAGIAAATGDIIAVIDSDDEYEPAAIATLHDLFERSPDAVVAFGDARVMEGQEIKTRSFLGARLTQPGAHYQDAYPPRLIDPASQLLFGTFQGAFACRRHALLSIGGYDPNLPRVNDRDLYLRLATEVAGDWVFTWRKLETKHYTEGSLSSRTNRRLHYETQLRVLTKFAAQPRFQTKDGKRLFKQAAVHSAGYALDWAGRESPAQVVRTMAGLPRFARSPAVYLAMSKALTLSVARVALNRDRSC
jgi:glycosyltransferase involved in cell wall biosynthesis